jgi:hypothetical protein
MYKARHRSRTLPIEVFIIPSYTCIIEDIRSTPLITLITVQHHLVRQSYLSLMSSCSFARFGVISFGLEWFAEERLAKVLRKRAIESTDMLQTSSAYSTMQRSAVKNPIC